jgi:hypothetical protein
VRRKRTRKGPSELDRQVDGLLGENVRLKMRGPASSHSLSLAGRCIAIDGQQVFEPASGTHIVVIEVLYAEDPPLPPPMSSADLQRLREAQATIKCPLPPGVTPRKR